MPQHFRSDNGLMERICEHGIGHPDFDSLPYFEERGIDMSVHGCCGVCCRYDLLINSLPARWIQEGYAAGSDGAIWSFWKTSGPDKGNIPILSETPHRLKPRVNAKGYLRVSLGSSREGYVHRLVYEAWRGAPGIFQVRHLDGDNSNCAISNLALGTQRENEEDKRRHGRVPEGESHAHSKLNSEFVLAARKMYLEGSTLGQIISALHLSVARSTLHEAIVGKTWKHV